MSLSIRRCTILAAGLVTLAASIATGQQPRTQPAADAELELLRSASTREAAGDLDEAERLLRLLLERYPVSPAAVSSLERVLRAKGDVRAVLPAVAALLSAEPHSSAGHEIKLRVMVEVDSVAGIAQAAEEWIRAAPRSEEPYRELAGFHEDHGNLAAAIQVLERGRVTLADSAALAVEMGALFIRTGDVQRGAREWARVFGEDGRGQVSVLRNLARAESGREEVASRLIDVLVSEPTTVARRRAATQIAVDVGLEDQAIRVGGRVARELDSRTRAGFLNELAGRAEASARSRVVLWALEQLRADAERAAERVALDQRIATVAEGMGETERALAAHNRIATTSLPGSQERRRALVAVVRLTLERGDARSVRDQLEALRIEFPDAPELDQLAGDVALWLHARGDKAEARNILAGLQGPWSTRERAFLDLADGKVNEGREQLLEAAETLPAIEATRAITMARALGKVQPQVGRVVAEAAVEARRGRLRDAEERLTAALPRTAMTDRPALLALAADFAEEAGRSDRALELRRTIARDHADSAEAPVAMLGAARALGERSEGITEAVEILERLILTHPESAVIPQARRELERYRARAPRPS